MSLGRSVSNPGISNKVLRRPDRPRPLNLNQQQAISSNRLSIQLSSVEDVVVMMENMSRQLAGHNYERRVLNDLISLCISLKKTGPQLENLYKDQLDMFGVAIRNACRDEELDLVSRVHLLEIIELRAMNWQTNENVSSYYRQKLSQIDCYQGPNHHYQHIESPQTAPATSLNVNAPDFTPGLNNEQDGVLAPGEVIANSGKFGQPTKIPGKNYFKDEIVIRNGDSGKVMGLKGRRVHMIEEMTETVISFQRVVPGARERLVQITGPAVENIIEAKELIEDTIRRNQSPMGRDEERPPSPQESICSSHDSDSKRNTLVAVERESQYLQEYKYTVNVGEESIRITGASLDLVRTAKLVLDEYFTQCSLLEENQLINMVAHHPNHRQPNSKQDIVKYPCDEEKIDDIVGGELSENKPTIGRMTSVREEESGEHASTKYDRSDLLKLSSSPHCNLPPSDLVELIEQIPNIQRKEKEVFDGDAHLNKGMSLFTIDYVKPYIPEFED